MARRKGKLYSILSGEFTVSMYYKPTMKGNDIYYFVILDDIIRLKMRFYDNCVLVVDEITQLSRQYIRNLYVKLFELLMKQENMTVLVSAFGYTGDFSSVCGEANESVPVVECPELFEYSDSIYTRFKDFSKNDATGYGFYLLSICPETFGPVRDNMGKKQPIDETDEKTSDQPNIEKTEAIVETKTEIDKVLAEFIAELNKVCIEHEECEYMILSNDKQHIVSLARKNDPSTAYLTLTATGFRSINIQLGDIGPVDMLKLLDYIIQVYYNNRRLDILFPNVTRNTIAFNAISTKVMKHTMSAVDEWSLFASTRDKVSFKIN